jgi:hypothetical protein
MKPMQQSSPTIARESKGFNPTMTIWGVTLSILFVVSLFASSLGFLQPEQEVSVQAQQTVMVTQANGDPAAPISTRAGAAVPSRVSLREWVYYP